MEKEEFEEEEPIGGYRSVLEPVVVSGGFTFSNLVWAPEEPKKEDAGFYGLLKYMRDKEANIAVARSSDLGASSCSSICSGSDYHLPKSAASNYDDFLEDRMHDFDEENLDYSPDWAVRSDVSSNVVPEEDRVNPFVIPVDFLSPASLYWARHESRYSEVIDPAQPFDDMPPLEADSDEDYSSRPYLLDTRSEPDDITSAPEAASVAQGPYCADFGRFDEPTPRDVRSQSLYSKIITDELPRSVRSGNFPLLAKLGQALFLSALKEKCNSVTQAYLLLFFGFVSKLFGGKVWNRVIFSPLIEWVSVPAPYIVGEPPPCV